jgi:hypothetical protein
MTTTSNSRQLTNLLLLAAAVLASLKLYGLINPFYIPTVDDSAIVMRYLVNFQHGHFFAYNVEDGPVYGISCFWLGLTAGALCWAGLDPQAALMTVALISTCLFFFAALRICHFASGNTLVSIVLGLCVLSASLFIPRSVYLGLETPLHLWLVSELILAFLHDRTRLFYVMCAVCIISKLDAIFTVGFLVALRLHDAYQHDGLRQEMRQASLFLGVPMAMWLVIATLIFGNPLPQSFQSKFFLRDKAPKTSWFPFLEPMVIGSQALKSMLLMLVALVLAILLRTMKKVVNPASSTLGVLFLGTMGLYYIYNPGERMAWYYALPEFLGLMSLATLPADIFRSDRLKGASKALLLLLSLGLLLSVNRLRAPIFKHAALAAPAWQIVYEKERLESGLLADAVAPKERPVLWTGHGYPAYLFHGYVVDYAGLNFSKIWPAVDEARHPNASTFAFLRDLGLSDEQIRNPALLQYKAELLLMKHHEPNVYMQHSLFPAGVQRGRHMRLAGSFYTVALVNAPSFRVFVEDKSWGKVTVALPSPDVQAPRPPIEPNQLWREGSEIELHIPANTSEIHFGIERGMTPTSVSIASHAEAAQRCDISEIQNSLREPEVQACVIFVKPVDQARVYRITSSTGHAIKVFEPAVTLPAGS